MYLRATDSSGVKVSMKLILKCRPYSPPIFTRSVRELLINLNFFNTFITYNQKTFYCKTVRF